MRTIFKTSFIATAMTAALAASQAAQAEVTVYGKLHASAGMISSDTGTSDTSSKAISSHASRFGIKTKKALDNGMEISAKAEFEYDTTGHNLVDVDDDNTATTTYTDSGTDTVDVTDTDTDTDTNLLKARNMYLGLKGGFGEVRVGNHDTPHKMSTSKLDVFGDTYADYNNIIQVDKRANDTVLYMNNFGDFKIAASYSAGDDSVSGENNGSINSGMISYKAGGLYLSAATEHYKNASDGKVKGAPKFGASYSFGATTVAMVYEKQFLKGSSKNDQTETYFSLKHKLDDKNTLKAAYGSRDLDTAGSNDPSMLAIGIDHKLDKSASVYALYADGSDGGLSKKGKLAGDGSALVVGAIYKF